MNVFIKCVVDSELKTLIIEGECSIEDLAEAWSNLYSEYSDLNKSNEHVYLLYLQRDLALLDAEITIIESLLEGLMIVFDKSSQDLLEKFDIYLDLNWDNQEDYKRQIIGANSSLAPMRLQYQMKEQEYEEYLSNKESDTIDRMYFIKQLRVIARFNKVVKINPAEITVEDFVLMLNELRENSKQWQGEGR